MKTVLDHIYYKINCYVKSNFEKPNRIILGYDDYMELQKNINTPFLMERMNPYIYPYFEIMGLKGKISKRKRYCRVFKSACQKRNPWAF